MATAQGPRAFDLRRRFVARLQREFASRTDLVALETGIAGLREAIDALSGRLDQLEQQFATRAEVAEARREVAVVRTGLRAVTNTVSALEEGRADKA
jgi:uncharacterized coiled-coil protein SlyX